MLCGFGSRAPAEAAQLPAALHRGPRHSHQAVCAAPPSPPRRRVHRAVSSALLSSRLRPFRTAISRAAETLACSGRPPDICLAWFGCLSAITAAVRLWSSATGCSTCRPSAATAAKRSATSSRNSMRCVRPSLSLPIRSEDLAADLLPIHGDARRHPAARPSSRGALRPFEALKGGWVCEY